MDGFADEGLVAKRDRCATDRNCTRRRIAVLLETVGCGRKSEFFVALAVLVRPSGRQLQVVCAFSQINRLVGRSATRGGPGR